MLLAAIETFYDKELDREFYYRPGTEDTTTIQEVFTFGYHIPPEWPFEPKTILDAGANIGLTMASYRYLFPNAKIVGVELDAENVAIARMNTNDPIVCGALVHGVVAGRGIRNYDGSLASNSYTLTSTGNRWAAEVEMDDVLGDMFHSDPVDFFKLDIEGAEKDIFGPSSFGYLSALQDIDMILVETHFDYTAIAAAKDLQRLGFRTRVDLPNDRAVFAWREP